jgi:hypothetical protein
MAWGTLIAVLSRRGGQVECRLLSADRKIKGKSHLSYLLRHTAYLC